MNPQILKDTLQQSLNGTMIFPQVVQTLLQEGVTSYHVDLLRHESRYYNAQGESHVVSLAQSHGPAAPQFSVTQVQAAIRKAQVGELKYPDFVKEILAAGCVYYIAYLTGEQVMYLGAKGERHVEMFPRK